MSELRVLLGHMGSYRRECALAAICVFCETSLELFIPVLTAGLIDRGAMAGDMGVVVANGLGMLACGLLSLAFGLGYARMSARAAMGLGASLRDDEYAAIQRYSFADLDRNDTSSLVTRLTTDVTVIQNALTSGFRPMLRGPVALVMGLAFACVMSPDLALVFFVMLPALAACLTWVVRHTAPLYGLLQSSTDHLNGVVQECLTAVRAIKAFVRGEWSEERFGHVNDELASTATLTFRTAVLNTPLFQAAMYATGVAVLWLGGRMVLAGTLGVGELTGFMSYVLQITNSLMMISNVFLLMTRALTSVHRVTQVLDLEPSVSSPATGATRVADGSVEWRGASMRHGTDSRADVLHHVSLRIDAGETLGVLGATGSGKTTLAQLVPRLYDVSAGSVLVGGRDVRDYDLAALRRSVGFVPQTCTLFSGTIRDNLLWGNAAATDEELLEACRLAAADEFLDRIGGLDARLGQGGSGVSGGQRQRLCIARALVARPKILVLDDSTSACDMATDARIRSALASLRGVTKIVIAQRVASVVGADRIAVLDDGRMHAVGTHGELLASDPIYQEMYRTQTSGAEKGGGVDGRE